MTLWTVARQAPLSLGFSKQEYWSGLPCHLQGIFPTQGSKLHLISPTLTGKFFTTSATFHKYFHHGKCSHHSQFKASDMMFLSMKLGRDANNWLLVLVSSSMLLKCCYRRQGKEWVQEDKEVKQECDLKVPPKLVT